MLLSSLTLACSACMALLQRAAQPLPHADAARGHRGGNGVRPNWQQGELLHVLLQVLHAIRQLAVRGGWGMQHLGHLKWQQHCCLQYDHGKHMHC